MSATGPKDIWALGERSVVKSPRNAFVAHWDGGSWGVINAPGLYEPRSIAAASSHDVWVVGGIRRILHWNGASWTRVALPRVPGVQLSAVSASGPHDVWVVGSRHGVHLPANSVGSHTLAYHYDGHRWSIIPTPNPDYRANGLTAAVSVSPTYTIVAATAGEDGYTMLWDGRTWHVSPLPAPEHHLHVSIRGLGMAGTQPWAVGQTGGSGYGNPVYLKWTGAIWQFVPMHTIDYEVPTPASVSGDSPFDVWATGDWNSGGFVLTHSTGHDFYYHHLPLPASLHASLADIEAFSPTDVWAVGGATRVQSLPCKEVAHALALVEHWDGHEWTSVPVRGLASVGS
jgi:WD40 repeat protein